jgi:hypothetical protein
LTYPWLFSNVASTKNLAFVSIFEHHLELQVILDPYNKRHVFTSWFVLDKALVVVDLLMEENLV